VLTIQYRMHPAGAAWSSKQLYGGLLRSGTPVHVRQPPRGT
jgi:superfamily I DNA and/or RNA helicase